MSTSAPNSSIEIVVLFARIPRYKKQMIAALAKKKGKHETEVINDIIDFFFENKNSSLEILKNLENVLVEHSKHTLEDSAKITTIVANIYATQLGAKSEEEIKDIPSGVFLLPASKEDKKGLFYCQGCRIETKNKYKHTIQVEDERIIVGDCCFFNNRYKDLIRAIL